MAASSTQLPKAPTGIQGFDLITGGGLPKGKATLVCGGPGCGKTLFAMEFLVRGAKQFNEPGIFMAFEETANDLSQNSTSLGFDLIELIAQRMVVVDCMDAERKEIAETGGCDMEDLFIRLRQAIDEIGAKRVVLDTIEVLSAGMPYPLKLRTNLRRLFRRLNDIGVTVIITGERGENTLTRNGLEEYVSDCVIVLDHRINDQVSERRLRIVKYRGSLHGTNEYPFLIDENGISVLPITSLGLQHTALTKRITTGIARLDAMLDGAGYYCGSSVLVSGTAGTGKSSVAGQFADSVCRRGERVLYLAYEESPSQIMRNLRSIGIDLAPWIQTGQIQFQAVRPTFTGLEMHLAMIHKEVSALQPQVVIMDPLTSFINGGNETEVKSMLMRLVDYLKMNQITGLFTHLTAGGSALEHTDVSVSSLIDTWLVLNAIEIGGERNRTLTILKSRGMAHSNQIREFLLTDHGVDLCDVYVGSHGVLTGSARLAQGAQEKAAQTMREQVVQGRELELERKRKLLETQIAALRAEFEAQEAELMTIITQDKSREVLLTEGKVDMGRSRKVDTPETNPALP